MKKLHPTANIQSIHIGNNTNVWQYCVVLPNAVIGDDCNICAHVFIENDVVVGNRVTIKSGVQLWDGVRLEDDVFVGPNVTFTNDLIPRSKHYPQIFSQTIVKKGASVGANSTIIAGHIIGEYSLIGAGSVVTKDIPANTVWYGNPIQQRGYITKDGILLDMEMKDKNGIKHQI